MWGGGRLRCTHRAVHTQGGAHTRRSVATAGVLLFKGVQGLAPALSEASRGAQCAWEGLVVHTQGGAYTRRCTYKAVHTQGGARTRQCIHKAGHTQGGLWPPQESCCLRGVQGLAPVSSEASRLSRLPRCTRGGGGGGGGANGAHGGGTNEVHGQGGVGANKVHRGGSLALTRRTGGGGGVGANEARAEPICASCNEARSFSRTLDPTSSDRPRSLQQMAGRHRENNTKHAATSLPLSPSVPGHLTALVHILSSQIVKLPRSVLPPHLAAHHHQGIV